jgi:D-hexose-6-phosphate mutarotase
MLSEGSTFRRGPGGLTFAQIENDLAVARICLQGAQLIHWQPRSQAESVTFTSAVAQYTEGKAIRAGVPICWPWFGPHPTDKARASHGFARNVLWEARAPIRMENGATQLSLRLCDSRQSLALWPYRFALDYRITVGEELSLELTSSNTGSESFPLSEALHAYFQVGDIGSVQVLGLEHTGFVDTADGGRRKQQEGPVTFPAEIDRVYINTEAACTIVDPLLKRRIHIAKRGSHSTVLWNPGQKKAAALADLGAAPATRGGWRQFVCVESANAHDNTLTLEAGQRHCLSVRYRAEPI